MARLAPLPAMKVVAGYDHKRGDLVPVPVRSKVTPPQDLQDMLFVGVVNEQGIPAVEHFAGRGFWWGF